MALEFSDKYLLLGEKQRQTETLKDEVSKRHIQLLQNFWKLKKPIVLVKKISFSQEDLSNWINKKVNERWNK